MSREKQLYETIQDNIFTAMANLHTAIIAKVTGVQATTISCRPVVNRIVDGVEITLPEFIEVPPVFMQGGGSYTAHPITVGDYCLLILTERCYDRWYEGQDFKLPAEYRMHDYSDGLAIVGINPRAGAITIPTVIQWTGDSNQDGNYTHQGDREHTGNYTLTGDMVINGNLKVNGNITCSDVLTVATATIGGIDFGTHTHPGDSGGTTGGPQ